MVISFKSHLIDSTVSQIVEIEADNRRKMLDDPRLYRKKVRFPRRDDYENRPVLSATIHPDLKRTLVAMSERTGMSVSQVTDEVLYTGLV